MIELTIKTPKKNYDLKSPSVWEEVTVNQFIQLESNWDGKDLRQLLSILTGLDRDILANSSRKILNQVDSIVSFIFTDPPNFNKLKRKATIKIDGKPIKMPKDLEQETFGAHILMMEILEDTEDIISKIPLVMAIYAQPVIDGKFIEGRIEAIEQLINNMPIVEVYPHCFFFWKRLENCRILGVNT